MRIRRLKLENWRAVTSREIEFGENVTLIEGPNEAGKSSLVEALRNLIRFKSSSAAKDIKAVQPVGEDLGSTVEAEIETGDWHFIYSKTFNREKGTRLEILKPSRTQLSGDEAHERVEQILSETVDLPLWEALLVDQGAEIRPVDIKDSAGLSRALDEAAGAGAIGEEDTDLFEAVEAEYLKYFTPTGRSRTGAEEQAAADAREKAENARAALREVEAFVDEQQRLAADVRAREQKLPELKQTAEDYEQEWRRIDTVRGDVRLKAREYEAAGKVAADARRALEEREALATSVRDAEAAIKAQETTLAPKREATESVRRSLHSAELVLRDLRVKRTEARQAMTVAQADARHLRQKSELDRLKDTLRELVSISAEIEQKAAIVANTGIDEDGLKALRNAENEIRVLKGQRDVAATRITVQAEEAIALEVDNETLHLESAESAERHVASLTQVRLPGVATISIEPPKTAADLATQVVDAEAGLAALYKEYGVANADAAAAYLASKQAASADLDQARRREQALIGKRSKAELEEAGKKLTSDVDGYEKNRESGAPMPATVDEAESVLQEAQDEFNAVEQKIAAAETKTAALQADLAKAESDIRSFEDALTGQRHTCKATRKRLEEQQQVTDDAAIAKVLADATAAEAAAKSALDQARGALDELNPERIELLNENAKQAWQRADREFQDAKTRLAVLDDRLELSRANGRFEQLEAAEREAEAAETKWEGLRQRADAAQRLYETITRYRAEAHQAFMQPLKDAIERLGRIVFGNDFEITLGDDWEIETRTLGGKTLPYAALSVGAKEQLGIVTRLAAAQIVAAQGGVPLIIDDALGFSDPSRLETMGAAITAAGRESQVVILTCAPGRFAAVGSATLQQF